MKPLKQRTAVLPRLLSYTKPQLPLLILSLVLSLIQVGGMLLCPVFIGRAVDYIIGAGQVDLTMILRYALYTGLSAGTAALCQYAATNLLGRVAFFTVRDMRTAAFNKLSALPVRYIDDHSHGDILSRIVTDIDQISDGLIQGFSQLFTGILTILGTLGLMLYLNWFIASLVVVITPLSLFVAYFIARGSHDSFARQASHRGQMSGFLNEMLGNQRTVKLFRREAAAGNAFGRINAKFKISSQNAQFYAALINPSTRFVNGLVYLTVCVVGICVVIFGGSGGLWAATGSLSVGALSGMLMYATQYTKPFNEITGVATEFQTAMAGARRVFALLDEEEQSDDSALPALKVTAGNVEIDDVSFAYIPERPLIQHFCLDVKSGQRIAIVGPTGCGKTTLINLLLRFYDADGGDIRIDGQSIYGAARRDLRIACGMVLQDTWLKQGTIADNIAYGKPGATHEEIVAAAKAARIQGFIERLANGYDTVLGENGELSEGQKQLLSIARVMLLTPPLLILDEATSSIDLRTEIRIQKAFAALQEGKTTFIVAHRLSTIQHADRILVMRDGNIIEQGTHDELLSQNGFYTEMYNAQFKQ